MRTGVAVLTGFFLVSPVLSQTSREEITVEVVEVPVYVFSSGKPLRNLTKDDFELFVNGKRQQVDYFDETDFAAIPQAKPPGAPPPIRDPRQRRLFLLLFDLVYNRPSALARCQKAAVDMIDHALPDDFFAVATYTSTEARYITAFTRDRDVLRRAVISLSPSSAHDSLAISITDAERQTAEAWMSVGGSSGGRGSDGRENDSYPRRAGRRHHHPREARASTGRLRGEVAADRRDIDRLRQAAVHDSRRVSPRSMCRFVA